MGTKNLLVLRTHFDSINTRFLQEFLYKNMIWILGSVRVFLCNYVLYSFGLILNYIFRFQMGGDRKTESDQFHEDYEIGGFREELANFLFQSYEDVFEDGREREEEPEDIPFMEVVSNVHEDEGKSEEEIESSALMEIQPDLSEDGEKGQEETECSVSMEVYFDFHENVEKEEEREISSLMEVYSDLQESEEKDKETENSVLTEVHENSFEKKNTSEGETECSVSMKAYSYFNPQENDKNEEEETECSVLMEIHCGDVHEDEKKREEKSSELMEADSEMSTRKYQCVSGRNIRGFMEEPTTMSFTFQEFYVGPNVPAISDNNAFSSTEIIAQKKESSEEEQENEFLGSLEALESESLNTMKEEKAEETRNSEGNDEKEVPKQVKEEKAHREKLENEKEEWKKMLQELECDEELEGDFEWEHDEIVEQLKMELRNARQGGLSTIVEEEEEEEEKEEEEEDKEEAEETDYPEDFEDQKQQKIEEKLEFEDQMDEIQEVYESYEDKMKKLDILNYQTMHGLGLLQLKDPMKSSFPNMKPIMSHNIWARKEAKSPLMKFVEELERDLELVYVGQVCLSWEILCWQHKKALQLKHYHHSHYNIAAGEFQLFQVLLQRFIENEPFQGPRTHNFVKNRCVIRNLLQVPAIRDDESSMKENNNMVKLGEEVENAVCGGILGEIIRESMWLFWKFVRADKENGHYFILRTLSHQTPPSHLNDPSLYDLLKHIKAHLHKKEKKLKDIVRTGNCIVRKFQKQHEVEQQLNHEQLLAQVGLKLVSRVLNLSKLRKDHLLWCNEKLSRIRFVKKKVLVEPSFLLFPC
ncbi:myb-like protein X [Senna tora]|uniref:Myb-like protein X n=1 Tax=Senna tora TaxID=362788 RepID=A0A834U1S5_9FABA|nr:myb-like protein X [Senna tora]